MLPINTEVNHLSLTIAEKRASNFPLSIKQAFSTCSPSGNLPAVSLDKDGHTDYKGP